MKAAFPLVALLAGCPSYRIVDCVDNADCDSGRACQEQRCVCAPDGAAEAEVTLDDAEQFIDIDILDVGGTVLSGLAFSADGCELYVGAWDTHQLRVYDSMIGEMDRTIDLPILPFALVQAGGALYIGEETGDTPPLSNIYRLGAGDDLELWSEDPIPYGVQGLAYDATTDALYVFGRGEISDEVVRMPLASGRLDTSFEPVAVRGAGPGVVRDGVLYFSGGSDLVEALALDLDSGALSTSGVIDPGASSGKGAVLSTDGATLYVGMGTLAMIRDVSATGLVPGLEESDFLSSTGGPDGYLGDLVMGPVPNTIYTLWTDASGVGRVSKVR